MKLKGNDGKFSIRFKFLVYLMLDREMVVIYFRVNNRLRKFMIWMMLGSDIEWCWVFGQTRHVYLI